VLVMVGSWFAFRSNVGPLLGHGSIIQEDFKSIPSAFQCDPVGCYLYQLILPIRSPFFTVNVSLSPLWRVFPG